MRRARRSAVVGLGLTGFWAFAAIRNPGSGWLGLYLILILACAVSTLTSLRPLIARPPDRIGDREAERIRDAGIAIERAFRAGTPELAGWEVVRLWDTLKRHGWRDPALDRQMRDLREKLDRVTN